jgi:hypothetical protein
MNRAMVPVFVLLMCFVQAVFGTSVRSLELRQVSSHFTVVVTHREKPIAGINVKVVPEGSPDPIFTKTTDANGTVFIDGLIAGRYFLTASHEEFDVGTEWIEVAAVPNAKAKKRLKLQWADWSFQTSRVAAGCGRSMGGFAFSPSESKPRKWWTRKLPELDRKERGRQRQGRSSEPPCAMPMPRERNE